ncbi:MAG: L-aspartate oxidase [Candidatus Margulisbacteria bacterium]|nr:L-aspartate oxidase [Candidatus Margulisiibacteriota bacterium]
MKNAQTTDVLIIGGGIAGLTAAIDLNSSLQVTIVTKGQMNNTNSFYAQGGVAVALQEPSDIPVHKNDTMLTGCELSDEDAVNMLVTEGPTRVWDLINHGVKFDRTHDNEFEFLKEAAHSSRRIMHVRDTTGFSIQSTLSNEALNRPNITLIENLFLQNLLVQNNHCYGAKFINIKTKKELYLSSKCTILATGGAGAVFDKTTNWEGSTGDGLAAAYLAGAEIRDMEFYQFHPTAILLEKGKIKNFLISESVRGEGAIIFNEDNKRFLFDYDKRGELAPRDIVARAIYTQLQNNKKVFLDMRPIPNIPDKFPVIYSSCLEAGIDLTKEPIAVIPAAHYMIGGIKTDTKAHTSITNLYACGEVASTGVHGANRLASNSLLECMVFGHKAAEDINKKIKTMPLTINTEETKAVTKTNNITKDELLNMKKTIQKEMYAKVGIKRNKQELMKLKNILNDLYNKAITLTSKEIVLLSETKNMLITAKLITENALKREESRGTHYREDFPKTNPLLDHQHILIEQPEVQ